MVKLFDAGMACARLNLSHGTAKVGFVFGPIMVVWFVALAVLGLAVTLTRRSPDDDPL